MLPPRLITNVKSSGIIFTTFSSIHELGEERDRTKSDPKEGTESVEHQAWTHFDKEKCPRPQVSVSSAGSEQFGNPVNTDRTWNNLVGDTEVEPTVK